MRSARSARWASSASARSETTASCVPASMIVFLDFEASSLGDDSYPIEVGWVFEDGRGENHLIRPAPEWTDWDFTAEAVHGISRLTLERDGEAHDAVARRMVEVLSGHELYATAPSWDGKWMSVLLRGAGLPRHALRLKDSDEAHLAIARASGVEDARAGEIMAQVREGLDEVKIAHRAQADAERELRIWREVKRLAGAA